MSIDAILKKIEALTETERAELKARISEQFPDPPTQQTLSPELAELLDERVAAANANPDAGYTMEEVYEESLRRLRSRRGSV